MSDPYQDALAREIALMGTPLSPNTAGLNTAEAIEEANEMLAPYGLTAEDIKAGAPTPFYEAPGSSTPGQSGLFQLTDNRFVEQPSSLSIWDKLGQTTSTFFQGGWQITPGGLKPYQSQTDWLKTNISDNLFSKGTPLNDLFGGASVSNLFSSSGIMTMLLLMMLMNNNRRSY